MYKRQVLGGATHLAGRGSHNSAYSITSPLLTTDGKISEISLVSVFRLIEISILVYIAKSPRYPISYTIPLEGGATHLAGRGPQNSPYPIASPLRATDGKLSEIPSFAATKPCAVAFCFSKCKIEKVLMVYEVVMDIEQESICDPQNNAFIN